MSTSADTSKEYHVFFWCHESDQRWAWVARTRMEACHSGIKCFCSSENRNLTNGPVPAKWIYTKMRSSIYTVIVLSQRFLSDEWSNFNNQLNSDSEKIEVRVDGLFDVNSVICLVAGETDITPPELQNLTGISVKQDEWWTDLMTSLSSQERIQSIRPLSNGGYVHPSTPYQAFKNGLLVCTLKSKHGNCGREQVDLSEMPLELRRLRLRLGRREYQNVLSYLMSAANFRFRFWCYNLPLTIFFFGSLLALCMTVIPLVEVRIYHVEGNGLEYLHAAAVWCAILVISLLTAHVIRRKMARGTYKRLSLVNSHLAKYNLLAGVEYLGIKYCNRFLLHLYFYNISACQGYIQELITNIEESRSCHNQSTVDMDGNIELESGATTSITNETHLVINTSPSTNVSIQIEAEDLLLDHSGSYIKLLSTNQLPATDSPRHMDDAMCLCQYAEQFIRRTVVS